MVDGHQKTPFQNEYGGFVFLPEALHLTPFALRLAL